MSLSIDQIIHLFESRGAAWYGGEAVTQLEHALQCAALAERDGASPGLIAACLLHDLGHLLAERGGDPAVDDVHQYAALPFLRGVFPATVLQPIRLHVEAKRYLRTVEPDYWKGLSPASKASLELQGGVLAPNELERFIDHPFARNAVRLRRYDDAAKVPGQQTPGLPHFVAVLMREVAPDSRTGISYGRRYRRLASGGETRHN